ncbi:MAG: DUF4040 domain-containing protein [Candidatus Omnitrophica bacterium]|nr:DUF4040 domain-containing protein [Candidatus Omnitrophota bacterium]MCM8825197.1 DUF4040 domain-containing protein [Candidatus Omnitrophota bacterium]
MVEFLIGVFIFFMIIAAIIALETSDLLSAIISVGAIGVAASICFLLVGAPDIAITQMVVEVLSLVILIRATIRHDLTAINGDREFFGLTITIALLFAFFLFGFKAFASLAEFGVPAMSRFFDAPSNTYINSGFKETGASNIVTSIILDYRGFDTLGEVTVLFTAIWGALAIMRVYSRKKRKNRDKHE